MEPGLDIMTRENLVVLLQSTGKKLEECEGECEVDTGRRIGADTIVSGEIQKVGTRYKLTLRLHDTHEGRLLASAIGSGKGGYGNGSLSRRCRGGCVMSHKTTGE